MAKTAEQTTQIAVVENKELAELIKKSGIELTKAEAHAAAFHPFIMQLSELSRPLADLDKGNPTKEHAAIARENRLKIVKVRTGSEAVKNERSEILDLEKNFILASNKFVKTGCQLTEGEYEEIEKHQERVEAQKRAELKQSRIALLLPYETDTEYLNLDTMDEDRFQALFAREKEAFEAVQAKRKQDELNRIEAERLAEEAIKAEKEAEQERIRLQAIENERLKKEAEIKDARTKELMPFLIMIRDFDGMVNMSEEDYQKELAEIKIGYQQHLEYQAEQQQKEKDRLEAENKAREKEMRRLELEAENAKKEREKLQAELEAKELAEESERLAKIAEQEEKDAKAKAALLAPDKEKINALYISIRDFAFPECQTPEANQIIKDVQEGMKIILGGIKTKSSNLK